MSALSEPESRDELQQDDSLLVEWAAELAVRIRDGQSVDWEELAHRNPERADALRRMLPAFTMMARMGSSVHHETAARRDLVGELGCLGDYRLLREVGRGGMGVVYEGYQNSLKRRVALKVLPAAAAMDARQLERFQIEARAAAALHHKNIVPVFAVATERGVPFYVMQFIEGRTLGQLIREMRHLDGLDPAAATVSDLTRSLAAGEFAPPGEPGENRSSGEPATGGAAAAGARSANPSNGASGRGRGFIRTVAHFGIQAADALEHAHQHGILHRDIKPSNLLVDRSGHLWVTDFGLARVPGESNLTMTGDVLGTLRYMSPEQALGKRRMLDESSDVYSLGATIYELLTLQPAFAGDDRQEVLRRIAQEEPRPPRRLNGAIPAALETIVLKAMARDPAGRYATAAALGEDLARFLDGRPILGRPVSAAARVFGWARRRPAVAALLTLVVMMACGLVTGVALWASWLSWHNHQLEFQIARADSKAAEAERASQIARHRQQQADRHRHAESLRRAREALDARQIELAQDILHEIGPGLDQNDTPGFAWGYLWRQANREFTQLRGHDAILQGPVVSADGKTLVTVDLAGKILIWALKRDMSPDHSHAALSIPRTSDDELRLDLSPDGRFLAITSNGSNNAAVSIVETTSGHLVRKLLGGVSQRACYCVFDALGERLALVVVCADNSHVVRSWKIADEKSKPHSYVVDKASQVLGTSQAGQFIVIFKENQLRIHDIWTGEQRIGLPFSDLSGLGLAGLFVVSDQGRVVAAHTKGDRILCWESRSGASWLDSSLREA